MNKIQIKARAKINITLDVLGKRQDGYHNVEMIMQTIDLYDTLDIEKIEKGINLKTNLPYLPKDERNIAYKAAQLFFDTLDIKNAGVAINIYKKIPVAAGLAGGSTDAASVLVALNKLFNTKLTIQQLKDMGKKLGADVPYCISGGTALAEGIGEIITPLPPMPDTIVVLAKPPISISTAYVYNKLNINEIITRPDTNSVVEAIKTNNLMGIAKGMYNVLEPVTSKEHRVINRIKNIMVDNGALNAIMSGSGPTVFGIFKYGNDAKRVEDKLRTIVSDVFRVKTYNSNDGEEVV